MPPTVVLRSSPSLPHIVVLRPCKVSVPFRLFPPSVARALPAGGGSMFDVIKKYMELEEDVSKIEAGLLPLTNTEKDKVATQIVRDFFVGWIMEPLMHGDYPISMKRNAGARIPAFTSCESKQVKGAYDFIGVIHYSNVNITDNSDALNINLCITHETFLVLAVGQDLFSNEEYPVTPWGLQEELNKFKILYGSPPIFFHVAEDFISLWHIGELLKIHYINGQRTTSNSSLQDVSRVKYLHGYIGGVLDALSIMTLKVLKGNKEVLEVMIAQSTRRNPVMENDTDTNVGHMIQAESS
ncbi:Glycoside hydrolase family 1 [Sesbania bispinosa]|nr:Glycoside hydrolase family 1 [Sesbania bispinosa]